ncbi:hypothetical protein [Prosthecobacter sp.]
MFSLTTLLRGDILQQKDTDEDVALPLPRWSEQEIRAFREHLGSESGVLLPEAEGLNDDLLTQPLPFGPRLDQGVGNANAEILPRLRPEDMRLFLPESLLGSSSQDLPSARRLPTPVADLKDVTPEFLAAGTNALPTEYLIDPAVLVTEMHQQELTRFLEFHAHDALIKLHILILGAAQKLPGDVNLDAMSSGSLAKGTACLVVYPLGEPWRARLFLSKTVHDHASGEFMKETARACVAEAMQSSDVHDQLRSYAVELSTRLFWLQKALGNSPASPVAGQPLAEISSDVPAQTAAGAQTSPLVSVGALSGLMVFGMLSRPLLRRLRQWRRLRLQNRVWLLPEVETVPRLGGAFTGGGGGMLCYAKTSA